MRGGGAPRYDHDVFLHVAHETTCSRKSPPPAWVYVQYIQMSSVLSTPRCSSDEAVSRLNAYQTVCLVVLGPFLASNPLRRAVGMNRVECYSPDELELVLVGHRIRIYFHAARVEKVLAIIIMRRIDAEHPFSCSGGPGPTKLA